MSADAMTRLNAALEGRYTVERQLGEGGMATVYLAQDLRHDRSVALKVLKPELAAVVGAERFLAEIKTTANLHHPHILPLFDSGEADGFLFYVMPYVQGETLRERIDREKQLPVDEAVRIATAVANALDHAHRHDVIHRDIKPANILLQDGEPMVADFGIALAVGTAGGGRLTETGLSVGTPYYMSPEQATGDQFVGAAADMYSLACVLYEMLVGEPPYTGATAQAVLGKIITGKPVAATEVRQAVPANIDAAIRKGLEKLPADRFTGTQAFAKALGDTGFRYGEGVEAGVAVGPAPLWNRLSVGLAAIAVVLGGALAWQMTGEKPAGQVERFVPIPQARGIPSGSMKLLPSGSGLVYGATNEAGAPRVWIRRWESLEPVALPGATGLLAGVVASPDEAEVAFIDRPILSVTPAGGGLVRQVADDARCCPRWASDGHIYYQAMSGGIRRVPAGGGPAEQVTERLEGDNFHGTYQRYPDADAAVFVVWPTIYARRPSTGERRELVPGLRPYLTSTGHLVFASLDGQIMAAPFDAEALDLQAPPVPLVDGVYIGPGLWPHFDVSTSGDLVYRSAGLGSGETPVWVTRNGGQSLVDDALTLRPANNGPIALSPDGSKVAFSLLGESRTDIWIKDLELDGSPLTRLTFDGVTNDRPTWTPDGSSLIFLRRAPGERAFYEQQADGSQSARLVLSDAEFRLLSAEISVDGEWLIYRRGETPQDINEGAGATDLYALRIGVDSVGTPVVATQFNETGHALSPDTRWLAYLSDESGQKEVYVRPFPNTSDGRWQVSTGGGSEVQWSRDGSELFYRNGQGDLVAAAVQGEPAFRVIEQTVLFDARSYRTGGTGGNHPAYAVHPDGERFLLLAGAGAGDVVFVKNWIEELKARVPN